MSKEQPPGAPLPRYRSRVALLDMWGERGITEEEIDQFIADDKLRPASLAPVDKPGFPSMGLMGVPLSGFTTEDLIRLEEFLSARLSRGDSVRMSELSEKNREWSRSTIALHERKPEPLPEFLYCSRSGRWGGVFVDPSNTPEDRDIPSRFFYSDLAGKEWIIVRPSGRTPDDTEYKAGSYWAGDIFPVESLGTGAVPPISEAVSLHLIGLLARRLVLELGGGESKYAKGKHNENLNMSELIPALSEGLPDSHEGIEYRSLSSELKAGTENLRDRLPGNFDLFEK